MFYWVIVDLELHLLNFFQSSIYFVFLLSYSWFGAPFITWVFCFVFFFCTHIFICIQIFFCTQTLILEKKYLYCSMELHILSWWWQYSLLPNFYHPPVLNSSSWWWTGRPGVLPSIGLQRVRHDRTELFYNLWEVK